MAQVLETDKSQPDAPSLRDWARDRVAAHTHTVKVAVLLAAHGIDDVQALGLAKAIDAIYTPPATAPGFPAALRCNGCGQVTTRYTTGIGVIWCPSCAAAHNASKYCDGGTPAPGMDAVIDARD